MLSHIYMHRMNRFQKSWFFDFLIDPDDCICLNWVLIYGSDMIFLKYVYIIKNNYNKPQKLNNYVKNIQKQLKNYKI